MPRIQMTRLGDQGRFGNQLLQYAFVRFHAEDHGLVAELPDWIGRDLFDLTDPYPSASLPHIDEQVFGSRPEQALSDRDVSGYFVGTKAEWKDRAVDFRALFTPGNKISSRLDYALGSLSSAGKTIVAVHLRRTDFGYGMFWVAPASWYVTWLRSIWSRLNRPVLYIATDDVTLIPRFAEFSPWDARRFGVKIPGADFIVDHHILRHADHLAISNSTFSFTAAMLNERATAFVRPHPNRCELVEFDPWESEVVLHPVIEHDRIPDSQRMILKAPFHGSDAVVYVGRHCSPWVHLARSVRRELRVYELEDDEGSLDQFRRRRGARQIQHLVVEDVTSLPRVMAGASETLSTARLDRMHFFVPAESTIPNPATTLSAHNYVLFASRDGIVERMASGEALGPGAYMAVHERLAPLLLGEPLTALDLPKLCREHGIDVRGIVHVGAHEGQELAAYESMGVARTVFVEANPAVHARLAEAVTGRPDVMAIHRAIDAKPGRVKFHLASSDRCASLLPLAAHLTIYPQIVPAGTVDIDATTLDALLNELNLPAGQLNLLRVGVQGAEARVLNGAKDFLRQVDAVVIEVSFVELYHRCAQIEDIDGMLGSVGFRRVAMVSPVHPSWAEAFYIRGTIVP